MDITARNSAMIVAGAIIVSVVTQIAYLTIKGAVVTAPMIWGTEAVVFLAIGLFALVPALRGGPHAPGWAALALFGVFNLVQAGIGLTMFGPLGEAGDALAPAMEAILAGAFFFFFTGKAAIGVAGLVFGLALLGKPGAAFKTVGGLTALAGLAALLTNLAAMILGRDLAMLAGGAGTAAAAFVAAALLILPQTGTATHR